MIDPVQHLSEGTKNVMDVAASTGAIVVAVSHVAAVLTPILTFLIALLTLSWWIVRLWDRFVKQKAD